MPDGTTFLKRLGVEHMQPITGSISIKEQPDTVASVTDHEAYFAAAQALMPGARLLADALPSGSAAALTLLSGHILEGLLKAFLSKVGVTAKELKKNCLRHNLSALWQRAEMLGLPIGSIPGWAGTLNGLYDDPYSLRYPMGLNGLVLPDAQLMMSELATLLGRVRERIGVRP
jgi:hypothetical protein